MKLYIVTVILLALHSAAGKRDPDRPSKSRETRGFWRDGGKNDINEAIKKYQKLNNNYARNAIVFIGDGMSLATTVAGRIKTGQDKGGYGEEYMSSLDTMPHVGLAKTYSVDNQISDSASTATAILSGVKTDNGRIGVDHRGSSCWRSQQYRVKTALHHAIEQGKSVGIVTTTRVQHATPASSYAHSPTRFWYSDDNMSTAHKKFGCKDIAQQLYDLKDYIQVIMGGGRQHMVPREEIPEGGKRKGKRTDGQNFIKMWKEDMKDRNGRYVHDLKGFNSIDVNETDYLLGLFSDTELFFKEQRKSRNQPTLQQMTEKAIGILSKNPKGYFLLVESGMIDKGHHQGRAAFAIGEFQQLSDSLQKARDMTSEEDTLIVTTADHGHVFTMGGKANRGNPVLGVSDEMGSDNKYYTTISYGNGPGYKADRDVKKNVHNYKYYQPIAAVPLDHESHSVEDTVIWSRGPHAHLLNGVHEQSYIGHVLFYAACLGPDNWHWEHCPQDASFMANDLQVESLEEPEELKEFYMKHEDSIFEGDGNVFVSHIH